MFQVKYRGTDIIFTVYAVRVGDDGQIKFLFWKHDNIMGWNRNFRWEWENADEYEPVEEEY